MDPQVSPISTLDMAYEQENENNVSVEVTTDALTTPMDPEEFRVAVETKITRYTEYWNKFKYKARQKRNRKYYLGDQINVDEIRYDDEDSVENALFRNLETFMPIVTSRTPEPSMTPAFKNEMTREYTNQVVKSLKAEWEVYQMMRSKVGRAIRNHQINMLAGFKLGRDDETGEYWTEEVLVTDVVISKTGDFVAHYIKDKTLGDLLDMFPEKKEEILKSFGYTMNPTKKLLDSPVEYIEAWTDELVGWIVNHIGLGVEKNPHFDYDGEDTQEQNVKYNFFKRPKMPYIWLSYFNLGTHIMDDTSLIEQGIGSQDQINKRKRQIGRNADSTNGHWVSSGEFISEEEFHKIQGGIDEKIWLESGLPKDGLIKITGQALPDYIYNDLQDSRSSLDNLMGTHATTRGEKSNNDTLGQDIMQKDQDYGRIDGYVRDGLEVFAQHWYEYMYHLYLVYGADERAIAIPEDDDFESDNIVFSRDMVPLIRNKKGEINPVPIVILVKQGSTLPRDEVADYQRAVQMKDILSPMDYFKMVGEPNPKQLTKNLLIWMQDPFMMFKDDKDITELMQRMSQKGQEQPSVSVSVKGDTPQGSAMLEKMGHIPPGMTQLAIANQKQAMINKSPAPGPLKGKSRIVNDESIQPEATAQEQQPTNGQPATGESKQGLINAMTQMLRSGEAQKLSGSAPVN